MDNQVYVPFVLVFGIIAYYVGKQIRQHYLDKKLLGKPAGPPAVAEAQKKKPQEPMFLVFEGPEKGLLVAMGPFARRGRGDEGTWVCVDKDDRTYVRVDGLDSQLGMVLLDMWALLGEDRAQATLARRIRVLPESRLHLVEAKLGGFTAMEGWLKVPSIANYQPPAPEDFPELLPLKLQVGETSIAMAMERELLLEAATRRTHPSASPRTAKPQRNTDPLEVMKMAEERYVQDPAMALALLEETFGAGPLPTVDETLTCGLAQIWGLTLRNLGRFDESVARFSEGLAVAVSPLARQELSYNRGYARLCSMMTSRQDHGDGNVTSSFAVDKSHEDALQACLADFEEASRLGPEDTDASSQVELTKKLLAGLAQA
ncbi:MAG: hypothetical protein GY913_16680 [Proteobacteria bacterium]|nr:hypothetical protein [Pseudomonadota bacterium]MCP4918540.1 hypothetical protein [Pseudomonadota bacterium]